MKLSVRSRVTAVVLAGLLAGRMLADCYRHAPLIRVIAMVDPPVWGLYPAILLHISATGRSRAGARSVDGLVTSIFV
jgi:hypothetical protein